MEYVWIVVALIIAGAIEFGALKYVLKSKYKRVLDEATKEADVIKEKKLLEVKEKFLNKKAELEKEVQQRNQKILQVENKLKQREMSHSQKQADFGKRKVALDNTNYTLNAHAQLLKTKEEELEKMQLKDREKLEELSGLSAEEAKKRLVDSLKDEARTNAQSYINEIMDDAKMTANKEAKRIVIQTIQRVATETAIENSVTVFHIDNDEVKGRIIG
uniref:Rnase Y domain-containing protein n=1 Tax=Alloprevotella sp. TaxID=1872471 RepID=UPI004024F21E